MLMGMSARAGASSSVLHHHAHPACCHDRLHLYSIMMSQLPRSATLPAGLCTNRTSKVGALAIGHNEVERRGGRDSVKGI
ncbi:unnamed protein product [Urochloa humidicola]